MAKTYYPEARIAVRAYFEDFGPQPDDGQAPATFHALPRSFTIQRTARHLPDTWSVEFDYESFPVDPDLIRAAAVEIWLWDKLSLTNKVEFVDSASTQLGQLRAALSGPQAKKGPIIYGMVKEASAELTGQSRVVRLDGEDYTSLFAKKKWHIRAGDSKKSFKQKTVNGVGKKTSRTFKVYRTVNLKTPVVKLFEEMVADIDQFGVMRLRVDALSLRDAKGNPNRSATIKGLSRLQGKGFLADQEDTYWDVMTKVAKLAGLSVYVEDTDVVLADPDTLYKESGVIPYTMRYGGPKANIETLTLRREFNKNVVPQVAVHAYDPKTRELIIEKYPTNAQQVVDGMGWKRDEVMIVPVRGTTDKKVLQALARDKFERTSRGERELQWSTIDLLDAPDDTDPLSLLEMRAGQPCYIAFDPLGLDLSGLTGGQRVAALTERGYTSSVAQIISDSYGKKSSFNFPFFLKEVKFSWAAESGLEISATCMEAATPGGIRRA